MLEVRYARTTQYVTRLEQRVAMGVDRVHHVDLPHRLMEDDEYNGYFLPKGSWVIGNIWLVSYPIVPNTRADYY
jgi:hypothetical protein